MTQKQFSADSKPVTAKADWHELYRWAAIATAFMCGVIIVSIGAFILWPYAAGTTPTVELFVLAQENVPALLTALDLGVSLSNLVSIVLFLALYVTLRRVNQSYALIALAMGLVGVAAAIAARPILEIFTLSEAYWQATTEAEASQYLAAGDGLLVLFHGTAFKSYNVLSGLSLLTSSVLLLRSNLFGKLTAWIGIIGNLLAIGFVLPGIGVLFAFASMLFLVVWFVMLTRHFWRLAQARESS